MFAQIIPAVRLPRKLTVFTYAIPEELIGKIKVGQIISTTFRGKKIQGVVKATTDKINFPAKNLKPLTKILYPEPLFSSQQLVLAEWLAKYYVTSLGLVVKSMIPIIPQKKMPSRKNKDIVWQDFTAKEIKIDRLDKTNILIPTTAKYQNDFIYSLIKNTKKQTLILVPETEDLTSLGRFIPNQLREKIVVFSGKQSKNEELLAWKETASGQKKIIIGTRQAVFAPLADLETIIVIDEPNSSFKQWDQNPRYDARTTATELAKIHDANIIFVSPAPRLEIVGKIKNIIKENPNQIGIPILNLKDEAHHGNYSLVSERLAQKIIEAKSAGQKTVLYINRRGLHRSVTCSDCGYVFNCPHCLLPLPFHTGGKLKCHHCDWQQDVPLSCPNCRGVNFRFPGSGGQLIEKDLAKIWPGCRVLRLDADVDLQKITSEQIDSADIYLGTNFLFKKIDWQKIDLVAILSLDNMLHLPGFRSGERLWQTLKEIELFATGSQTDKIYLQTFNSENRIIRDFVGKNNDDFYTREIEARSDLGYPPFGQLIKLIYQSSNPKKAEFQANTLFRELTKKQEKDKIAAQISEPQTVFTSRVRGRWRYVIIIKTKINIDGLLQIVPDDWIIDVDPEDLI
ncbi:MAG: primosomal protein N' [Patescibacteria group bacterium]|jgi:primosomal protein N' (replication factor Y)